MTYHPPMTISDPKPAPPGARARVYDWLTRASLLSSNLAPLAVILAILAARTLSIWMWIFGAAAVVGILATIWILQVSRSQSAAQKSVTAVEDAGNDVAAYLASYILPFLAVAGSDWYNRAAYIVFGVVLIVIFLNSNLLAVSPVLYLFGYRLFKVEFADNPGVRYFTICRSRPAIGQMISVTKWGSLLVRSRKESNAGI